MIDTVTLNQVAASLGTTDKNVVFSAILKTLVDAGISVDVAFDHVFGPGSYTELANTLYAKLTATNKP